MKKRKTRGSCARVSRWQSKHFDRIAFSVVLHLEEILFRVRKERGAVLLTVGEMGNDSRVIHRSNGDIVVDGFSLCQDVLLLLWYLSGTEKELPLMACCYITQFLCVST